MEKMFRCIFKGCTSIFSTKQHQERHEISTHQAPVECPYENCNKLVKLAGLNDHIKCIHENVLRLPIETSPSKIIQDYKNTDSDKFLCPYKNCGVKFSKRGALAIHLNKTHPLTIKCPYKNCQSFVEATNLGVHFRGTHKEVKERCKNCEKWILINNFSDHSKNCGKTGKPYFCSYKGCKATFSKHYNKLQHLENVHGPRVKCTYGSCTSLVQPRSLGKHIREYHEKIKKQCINCNKKLAIESFEFHFKKCISSGEKKFACTFGGCKTRFTTLRYRSRHIKTVHKSSKEDNNLVGNE